MRGGPRRANETFSLASGQVCNPSTGEDRSPVVEQDDAVLQQLPPLIGGVVSHSCGVKTSGLVVIDAVLVLGAHRGLREGVWNEWGVGCGGPEGHSVGTGRISNCRA